MIWPFVCCVFMMLVCEAVSGQRRGGFKDRQDEAGKLADSYRRAPAPLQGPKCRITRVDGRETEWSPKTKRLQLKISRFLISNGNLLKL